MYIQCKLSILQFFWNMTPYISVAGYWLFLRSYCPHLSVTLKKGGRMFPWKFGTHLLKYVPSESNRLILIATLFSETSEFNTHLKSNLLSPNNSQLRQSTWPTPNRAAHLLRSLSCDRSTARSEASSSHNAI